MNKSSSESISHARPLPRRSPRFGTFRPSETLMDIKRNMKLRANKSPASYVADDYEAAQNAKDLIKGETGIVYDTDMMKHYCVWDRNHPECPERLTSVLDRCNELGLISRCQKIEAREATEKELLTVHSPEHLEVLKASQNLDNYDDFEELSSKFDSIYINDKTYQTAAMAAGCAIELIDAMCQNKVQNGMALIRPPGHHAGSSGYCGYCFFNNAALAAKRAITKWGHNRILIVDWDVHHGQGTQQIFYDDPRVIYFSIHRYERGTFWPQLRESNFDFIGEEAGTGFNFNVPLNDVGLTDSDYLAVFHNLLIPLACQYEPQLIIVSAGYDSAVGCPEGRMLISPACFSHLVSSLLRFAQGNVAVLLEGGYCLESLAESAALTLRALLGDPIPRLATLSPISQTVAEAILNVIYVQRKHWPILRYHDTFKIDTKDDEEYEKQLARIPVEARHVPVVQYEGDSPAEKPSSFETRNCYPVKTPEEAEECSKKLLQLKMSTDLFVPLLRVSIAYDAGMTGHENVDAKDHPERPERILGIFNKHIEYGLLNRCSMIKPRVATKAELLLFHTERYVNEIKESEKLMKDTLVKKGNSYDSVYLNQKSFECASLAVGSLIELVRQVLLERTRSGVAIIRPPGHHAEADSACGFCLFNNVALAAKYAIETHGLRRVLLVDWDVHHGNGTQHMFEDEDRVLNVSLHRYNHGKFFPSSPDGNYDKVGVGKGEGFNINIPWNKPGGGVPDGDYIAAFNLIVMPVAYHYNPELVLVSAGFDACVHDPLGNCKVTPEAYGYMTHCLTSLANGRVVLALEGGYNVTSISYALTLCTKALLGDPLPPFSNTIHTTEEGLETIRTVIKTQAKYWPCLAIHKALPSEDTLMTDAGMNTDRQYTKAEKEEMNDILERMSTLSIESKRKSELQDGDRRASQRRLGEPDRTESKRKVDPHTRSDANSNERRSSQSQKRLPVRDSDPDNTPSAPSRPTLVGYLSENMQRLINEEMFAVVPLPGCPHLPEVQPVPASGIDVLTPCIICGTARENWICLVCYSVFCGRYINQHMLAHNEDTRHPLTLSFSDLSVWCYVCEAYIDNMVLYPAKNAAHRSKFGCDLQWSYGGEDRQRPA